MCFVCLFCFVFKPNNVAFSRFGKALRESKHCLVPLSACHDVTKLAEEISVLSHNCTAEVWKTTSV